MHTGYMKQDIPEPSSCFVSSSHPGPEIRRELELALASASLDMICCIQIYVAEYTQYPLTTVRQSAPPEGKLVPAPINIIIIIIIRAQTWT